MMKQAIALLSSGLDSTVALAMALDKGIQIPLCLTFDYGQRAAQKETAHAMQIAHHFGIPYKVLTLPWFYAFQNAGKLLEAKAPLPHPTSDQLLDLNYSQKSAKAVWVPNRNGVFIEIAASYAENLSADGVLVGFNKEEAATFPDNSKAYLESLNQSLSFSTANQVKVFSPTASLNKAAIVREAISLSLPFELLWTCYEDQDQMCGRCESCMRLKSALSKNEVSFESYFQDPIL